MFLRKNIYEVFAEEKSNIKEIVFFFNSLQSERLKERQKKSISVTTEDVL